MAGRRARDLLPPWRAPFAVAAVVNAPLFFAALMAATLAVEKPRVIAVQRKGGLAFHFETPTAWNEAKIWLLALAVTVILALVGVLACYTRRGVYVVGAAGIVLSIALVHRLDEWTLHHSTRYIYGADLISPRLPSPLGPPNPSDILLRGEWEASARQTVLELHWVVIGLSAAAIVVALVFELRRRRGPAVPPPPAAALAESTRVRRGLAFRRRGSSAGHR